MTEQEKQAEESPGIRMELNYCERCGALSVHAAGAPVRVCPACVRALQWLRGGGER